MFNQIKKITVSIIVATIISVVAVSCNSGTVYNQNFELPSTGWFKDNAIAFNVQIDDSLQNYDFSINIRNSVTYRYSNLYIFLTTEFPNGNISCDTIEFIFANDEGTWLGKGWGDIKENNILLNSNLRFPLTGEYSFLIQQAMRVDTLQGINSIGLSVTRNNSN